MHRSHSPQDQIYGPLEIPYYCWPFIDTPEFQRLRYVSQLGPVQYVFPGANHSRFEHSLGCAHLATKIMNHFQESQPELQITEQYRKIVIIAALCHDLGHGPFSHLFDSVVHGYDAEWSHENMSAVLVRHINKTYNLGHDQETIDAICDAIQGYEREGYPEWLFTIVANKENDVDIDKFDYLSRDINKTLCISRFEYDRLIVNCRIMDNKLTWKISEIPTLERLFFNRNDMHNRVYTHRVAQSIGEMIHDMLIEISNVVDFNEIISDPAKFCQYDDRILYKCELGEFGEKAKQLADDIKFRRIYKCVGELRIKPGNLDGETYSQQPSSKVSEDISESGHRTEMAQYFRVCRMRFRYGINKNKHPLLGIPFWKQGSNEIVHLTEDEISCIVPQYFAETAMRIFCTDPTKLEEAKKLFEKWRESSIFF